MTNTYNNDDTNNVNAKASFTDAAEQVASSEANNGATDKIIVPEPLSDSILDQVVGRKPIGLTTKIDYKDARAPFKNINTGRELMGEEEGFIIGQRGIHKLRIQPGDHMITIARTGAGKGTDVAIPNLLDHAGSVFSVEIGGATLNETIDYRRNILKQKIVVIDPYGETNEPSDSFNILDALNPESNRFETDVSLIARSLLKTTDGDKEQTPYFELGPAAILRSFIYYVITSNDIPPERKNLGEVRRLLGTFGSSEWTALMESFATDSGPMSHAINETGNYFKGQLGQERDENKNSLISTITFKLDFPMIRKLMNTFSHSTFDLKDLRNDKMTVYIVMPDVNIYKEMSAFLRMMLEAAFNALPNLGDAGRSFEHKDRVLFMIDEFTQLGKIDEVATGMLTLRQKGVTLWTMFHDIAMLKEVYGDNRASSFLGAATCLQVFNVNEEQTLDYISKRAGKSVVYIPSVAETLNVTGQDTTNWSRAKTIGDSTQHVEGIAIGDGETYQTGVTNSFGESLQVNITEGGSIQDTTVENENRKGTGKGIFGLKGKPEGTQTGGSHTEGSNFGVGVTSGVNRGDTISSSTAHNKTTTRNVSNSYTESSSITDTTGGGESIGGGYTYSITYTGQLLPRLETSDAAELLSEGQILFISGRHKKKNIHLTLLEGRVSYYSDPVLYARAYGPHVIGAPKLLSPLEKPTLPEPHARTKSDQIDDFPNDVDTGFVPYNLVNPIESDEAIETSDGKAQIALREWLQTGGLRHDLYNVADAAKRADERSRAWFTAAEVKLTALWNDIDSYAQYLELHEATARGRARLLEIGFGKFKSAYDLLENYRSTLKDDYASENAYRTVEDQYKGYIEWLIDMRTEWHGIDVPTRPAAITSTYTGAIDDAVITRHLDDIEVMPTVPALALEPNFIFADKADALKAASARQIGKVSNVPIPDYKRALVDLQVGNQPAKPLLEEATRKREKGRALKAFAVTVGALLTTACMQMEKENLPAIQPLPYDIGYWHFDDRIDCNAGKQQSCIQLAAVEMTERHNDRIRGKKSTLELAQAAGVLGLGGGLFLFGALGVKTRQSRKLAQQYRETVKEKLQGSFESQKARAALCEAEHNRALKQLSRLKDIAGDLRLIDAGLDQQEDKLFAAWGTLYTYRDKLDACNDVLEARRDSLHNNLCRWEGWGKLEAQTHRLGNIALTRKSKQATALPCEAPSQGKIFDNMQCFAPNPRFGYTGTAQQSDPTLNV